jgi:hypothetical protein
LSKTQLPTYRGRTIGIVALTGLQVLIGAIHVFFGVLLFTFGGLVSLQTNVIYDSYTIAFGLLTIVFAAFIWQGKKIGWVGTIAVSVFVIVADSLTLLDLPSVPGIPKSAGATEIIYSLIVIYYLMQKGVRAKYLR